MKANAIFTLCIVHSLYYSMLRLSRLYREIREQQRNNSFWLLLIFVSQRFTVISRIIFFFSGWKIKKYIICHNIRSFICLILRQTVDWVENICNYLGNWLVDNYADSYLDIFRTLRTFLFRNWSAHIDYKHLFSSIFGI